VGGGYKKKRRSENYLNSASDIKYGNFCNSQMYQKSADRGELDV